VAFSKEKAHDRAERYAAKGQHDKAAREYQAIVDNDPKDIRAWLMLADCLVRCGDAPRAISRYLQVAGYYVEQRQPQKALAVYRQVLNLDQSRLDVQMKVAALNLKLGRTPDAIAVYERVAQVQMQSGQVEQALSTFRSVADADPSAVSKRLRLAELYSRERRREEAVEAFRMAGEQLLAADRKTDFVRVAERLLYHDNGDRPTMRLLAKVYLELGDPRRALMKLNALLHADPSDREGIELLAETFMALGKLDKALSVIGELARELGKLGPSATADTKRVLRRGLTWSPGHPEFTRALAELDAGEPDVEDVAVEVADDVIEEVDADELMELDDDDLVVEDDGAEPGAPRRPAPSTGSLTQSVLSEADADDVDLDELTDLDKILFEARVYVKYRLFEHALDHVQQALEQEPDHVGALSLKARALSELGRIEDAAEAHVAVARRVATTDPKLAREHVSAALGAVPGHAGATHLGGLLDAPAAAAPAEPDGDSGMFDVMEPSRGGEAIPGADSSASLLQYSAETSGDDFQIDVSDEPEPELERAPMPVENRFGISQSGPLPASDAASSPPDSTPPTGFVPREPGRSTTTEGTPAAGFVPRPPSPRERTEGTPAAGFQPRPPSRVDLEPVAADAQQAAEEVVAALERGVEFAEEGGLVPSDPLRDPSSEIHLDFDADLQPEVESYDEIHDIHDVEEEDDLDLPPPLPAEPAPAPRRPEPTAAKPASKPAASFPDLSEDLAEIRFYMDQGLDDDAAAALADLRSRHPGHPELASFGAEEASEDIAAASLSEAAAQPLVDVDEAEEEDEDAYLAAIFGDPADAAPKEEVGTEMRARIEGEQDVDAQTAYDLGLAYREMGLIDDAIGQFELAAKDRAFRSRGLVMIGTLRIHRGETEQAVGQLREAVELATTEDESSQANYELGLLYEKIGDTDAAVAQLQAVSAGFRDRDERLSQLMG
jgi:tetratricopeptide (TPR) repeat protein